MNEDFYQQVKNITAKDSRYNIDAYEFVMQALHYTQDRLKRKNHVTGRELLEGIKFFAYEQFGPMALTVLSHWGVHLTDDIGEIVFNLIEYKLLSKTETDTRKDFKNVYDFNDCFGQEYQKFVSSQIKEEIPK